MADGYSAITVTLKCKYARTDIQVNLRLPPDLLAAVDAIAARRSAENLGCTVTRSDVVRESLVATVKAAESTR